MKKLIHNTFGIQFAHCEHPFISRDKPITNDRFAIYIVTEHIKERYILFSLININANFNYR